MKSTESHRSPVESHGNKGGRVFLWDGLQIDDDYVLLPVALLYIVKTYTFYIQKPSQSQAKFDGFGLA